MPEGGGGKIEATSWVYSILAPDAFSRWIRNRDFGFIEKRPVLRLRLFGCNLQT